MGHPSRTTVTVVAAVLWREDRLLVCQRKDTDAFPCKWEFPGGKLEPNEVPSVALERELFEELGIRARIGDPITEIDHQYPGCLPVHLIFFAVHEFEGSPENRVFRQILWIEPQEVSRFDFLEADRPLIDQIAAGKVSPRFP